MGVNGHSEPLITQVPGGRSLVRAIDFVVNWARANSLWPLTYGTSCCAIEMMATSMPRYDISRFGSEVFRASPRQADLIILAGTIVDKMAEPLVTLYEQLPGPKYVMAMGSCTISGGPFIYDNYSVVRGADQLIPVDVFIPGCPPRPETLLHGLMELQKKIRGESILDPWNPGHVAAAKTIDDFSRAADAWVKLEEIKQEQMAEAQARFRQLHPDYKPQKTARVVKPAFAPVDRTPTPPIGMSTSDVARRIGEGFPSAIWGGGETLTPEQADAKGMDFIPEFTVGIEQYLDFVTYLRNDRDLEFNMLVDLTAVDWTDHYDLVVQLRSVPRGHRLFVRTSLAKIAPQPEEATRICPDAEAPSLVGLYPSADWPEREVFDLFGIRFNGHPDLRRLFLKDDFDGHPLRKNFAYPEGMLRRPY